MTCPAPFLSAAWRLRLGALFTAALYLVLALNLPSVLMPLQPDRLPAETADLCGQQCCCAQMHRPCHCPHPVSPAPASRVRPPPGFPPLAEAAPCSLPGDPAIPGLSLLGDHTLQPARAMDTTVLNRPRDGRPRPGRMPAPDSRAPEPPDKVPLAGGAAA